MVLAEYAQVVEAAALLDVHPETVKRLCRQGDLPATKQFNTWLIRRRDLKKFAATYHSRPGRKPGQATGSVP